MPLPVTLGPAYVLAWPREALRVELEWLLRQSAQGVLEHEAELVLEDAFTTSELRDDLRARPRGGTTGWSDDPWSTSASKAPGQRDLLVDLLEGLDRLPERRSPRPYWIQRQGRRLHPAPLPEDERYARLRASWATTVHRFQSEGYLAKSRTSGVC